MKRLLTIVIAALAVAESAFSQEFDKKNLLYRINPIGNNTVELLGFEKKPKEELIIPEEVSYKGTKYIVSAVGENAFKDCEVLTRVVGTTIQEIKGGAFEGCRNLSSIVLSGQLCSVGKGAFHGCTSLNEIVLGYNIQSIGNAAFEGCSNLKELSLGNSLKSIGTGIINETGISSITLPASLTNIGHDAFAHCKSLSSVSLTEGLKVIEQNAFTGTSLTSIVFPNTLESIGEKAFADCVDLKSISFKNGLKDIGSSAFARTGIEQLTLPNSLKEVKAGTFEGCEVLQTITLGDGIEEIRNKAFANCRQLTVDFSDVPCNIAENAFLGCKDVVIGDYSLKGLSRLLKDNFTLEEKEFSNGLIKVSKNKKLGYINKMGQQVIPCIYDYVERRETYIMVSKNDDKYGFYSLDGKEGTQCIYDEGIGYPYAFLNGIGIVKKNGKYGFVTISGKEVLPCIYDEARDFQDDICWCRCESTWYAINKQGKAIYKVSNAIMVNDYNNGIATVLVEDNGKYEWRIINKDGSTNIVSGYKFYYPHGYGLIRVEADNGKYGLIDKNQNIVLPAEYEEIRSFHNGLATVIKQTETAPPGKLVPFYELCKEGAIDSTGRIVIPCKHEKVYLVNDFAKIHDNGVKWYVNKNGKKLDVEYINDDWSYGFAVAKKEGKYGLIDGAGIFVTPYLYDKIERPTDGLLIVKNNNKYGYIDMTGKEIIPTEWSNAEDFSDGLARVERNGVYYYIDKSGKEKFRLNYKIYDDSRFHDDMLLVTNNAKYGYVDKTGKLTVPCIYTFKSVNGWDMTNNFSEGLACVYKDGKIGFVDKKGRSTFDY